MLKKVTTTIIENKCGETGDSPTKKLRNHVRKNEADQTAQFKKKIREMMIKCKSVRYKD